MNEREYDLERIPDKIEYSSPKSGQEERRNRRKAERKFDNQMKGLNRLIEKEKLNEPRSYTK